LYKLLEVWKITKTFRLLLFSPQLPKLLPLLSRFRPREENAQATIYKVNINGGGGAGKKKKMIGIKSGTNWQKGDGKDKEGAAGG